MKDRRESGYPEFVELLERQSETGDLWDKGRLAAVNEALHGSHRSLPRPTWLGLTALWEFLREVPTIAGAPDTATFVIGASPPSIELLSTASQETLQQWYEWVTELYTMALTITANPHGENAVDVLADRLMDMVYAELDPLLSVRLRHWLARP